MQMSREMKHLHYKFTHTKSEKEKVIVLPPIVNPQTTNTYTQCIKEQLNLAWRTLTFAIPNICLFSKLKIAFPLGLILICHFCLCLSYLLAISLVLLNIT